MDEHTQIYKNCPICEFFGNNEDFERHMQLEFEWIDV